MFASRPLLAYIDHDAPNRATSEATMSPQTPHTATPHARSVLTARQRTVLEVIDTSMRERGYPPSVREIGETIGLTSSSSVHAHLSSLQKLGYLRRDPAKPRAIEVRWDPASDAAIERRPVTHVPLIGEIAAGTGVLAQENVEDSYPLPSDFTGPGELFMLKVRGESMIDAAICDGDYVVVRAQPEAQAGDIVAAGIADGEATIKFYKLDGDTVVLTPANPTMKPMRFSADDVTIYGKVVTVLRKL